MSEYDYLISLEITRKDYPFYALIAAAMSRAGPEELKKLVAAWPNVWRDFTEYYTTPGIIQN